jgi:hypothetical protein
MERSTLSSMAPVRRVCIYRRTTRHYRYQLCWCCSLSSFRRFILTSLVDGFILNSANVSVRSVIISWVGVVSVVSSSLFFLNDKWCVGWCASSFAATSLPLLLFTWKCRVRETTFLREASLSKLILCFLYRWDIYSFAKRLDAKSFFLDWKDIYSRAKHLPN